ncbi:hypothetical protein EVAR_52577_1 [Eumeta japonica]|uniref:Uncharacterized protein n=1 Tax=Eumeta variegata TaxID=151549 RepID=A0A4C1YDN7_EUMVA|nr:hypothetical protein EVAR_52577_1 [Eumeta japonica]
MAESGVKVDVESRVKKGLLRWFGRLERRVFFTRQIKLNYQVVKLQVLDAVSALVTTVVNRPQHKLDQREGRRIGKPIAVAFKNPVSTSGSDLSLRTKQCTFIDCVWQSVVVCLTDTVSRLWLRFLVDKSLSIAFAQFRRSVWTIVQLTEKVVINDAFECMTQRTEEDRGVADPSARYVSEYISREQVLNSVSRCGADSGDGWAGPRREMAPIKN